MGRALGLHRGWPADVCCPGRLLLEVGLLLLLAPFVERLFDRRMRRGDGFRKLVGATRGQSVRLSAYVVREVLPYALASTLQTKQLVLHASVSGLTRQHRQSESKRISRSLPVSHLRLIGWTPRYLRLRSLRMHLLGFSEPNSRGCVSRRRLLLLPLLEEGRHGLSPLGRRHGRRPVATDTGCLSARMLSSAHDYVRLSSYSRARRQSVQASKQQRGDKTGSGHAA